METISKGAEGMGRTLGGASEGGAAGLLDMILSPGGLVVIGVAVVVAMWMGRK